MSRFDKWNSFALLAASGILSFLLFVKPILGVADNGDFLRIMGSAGLSYLSAAEPPQDHYFAFMHKQYAMDAPFAGGYVSSQIILVFAASWIAKLLYDWHVFDIRFLGALYSLLLLTAFALLLRLRMLASPVTKCVFTVLFLLVFFDVGYTAYFNSFFGEPMALVFLLLTIAAALHMAERQQPRTAWFVFFIVSAIFLAASKIQNSPTGVILALLALRLLPLLGAAGRKKTGFALTALLLLVSCAIYATAPRELRTVNQYQSVFYGILKDSPSPERDLDELGLDPALARLAGTHYFMPDTPIPQQSDTLKQSFYPRISHGKIAMFYLRNPGRYWDKLEVTASKAMTIHIGYLGNYEKSAGLRPGSVSTAFDTWSVIKERALPHSIWFLGGFAAVYYAVIFALYAREPARGAKAAYEVFMAVGLIGAVAFLVPVIGDGEADMEKHLFLFNVCFDVMWTASLVWLAQRAVNFVKARAS